MTPTKAEIKKEIKRLREYIDGPGGDDIVAAYIAQEVETALRWAVENTVDWDKPLESAIKTADLVRRKTVPV